MKSEMFTNRQLRDMILPLFLEQLLVMLVGIADTLVVSYCGEAAVSGVSLVNCFNTIFIYVFSALASGGAVVVSQYLGRGDRAQASESVSQLLMFSSVFSMAIMALTLAFRRPLLTTLFGNVEPEVMEACLTYLRISAWSYPALAIYNSGAALYRSVGRTKTTMYLSVAANALNVAGNLIGVFALKAGVAGVAYPTFIARWFSAIVITVLCFKDRYGIRYYRKWIFSKNDRLLVSMLRIAAPNALESGIFQGVKVALSSMISMFGISHIAANGIGQSIWNVSSIFSVSMGPAFITVIGQCMGAREPDQARYYFRKLVKISIIGGTVWNTLFLVLTPFLMRIYQVTPETRHLVLVMVLIHNLLNATAYTCADPLGKGLRATGDVRFTTVVSIFTSVGVRLVFATIFAVRLNMGVLGVTWAMVLDWAVRGGIFLLRLRSGKWREFKVIE